MDDIDDNLARCTILKGKGDEVWTNQQQLVGALASMRLRLILQRRTEEATAAGDVLSGRAQYVLSTDHRYVDVLKNHIRTLTNGSIRLESTELWSHSGVTCSEVSLVESSEATSEQTTTYPDE